MSGEPFLSRRSPGKEALTSSRLARSDFRVEASLLLSAATRIVARAAPRILIFAALLFVAAVAAPAQTTPSPPNPRLRFAPLDLAAVGSITPLGNLNPRGGHVFPTDHIYFDYGRKPDLSVYAPAEGLVQAIRGQSGDDFKIEVKVNARLSYYVAHLYPEKGIKVGSIIAGGQVIGKASGRGALDLGCMDAELTLKGFVNPKRYPSPTLHAASPFQFYEEPLRGQLYAKVERAGADKDGKIDFDVPGRLVGNWFLEGLPVNESARGTPETWAKQLAFVYDVRKPDAVRISFGGAIAPAADYEVAGNAPDPATVSEQSGVVKYELAWSRPSRGAQTLAPLATDGVQGVLLAQVLPEHKLKVEYFPGKRGADVKGFTGAARIYER